MSIFYQGKRYVQFDYKLEEDFERDVVSNYRSFFGENVIYIDAKKKIEARELGGTIPDGFLFDLSDKENPEFYLVENELAKHDFYSHIFPQVTKFFAFFKNSKSQSKLVDKIFSSVNDSPELKSQFKKYLVEKELYKFFKDVIEGSQNILLLIDEEKAELPEIIDTYSDTWGKMVKLIIVKKYFYENDSMFSLNPDFENIEYLAEEQTSSKATQEIVDKTEEYHLEGTSQLVKDIYLTVKNDLIGFKSDLIFNPQKYYISIVSGINLAYFKFRKKKIRLIVMMSFEEVKDRVTSYPVKELSESVQRFYNGPCCGIYLENLEDIGQIISLLKDIISSRDQLLKS